MILVSTKLPIFIIATNYAKYPVTRDMCVDFNSDNIILFLYIGVRLSTVY